MSRPVNAVPPLPYPGRGVSTAELAAFDQDLTRALHAYLSELARRANDCLPKDGQEIMTGPLRLTDTGDATLTSTLHPFQIGASTAANIIADGNEIMARNNGAISTLNLNAEGGEVSLHANAGSGSSSLLRLVGGRILFPATQQSSTDANTLDDYEEGTWTPVLTYATPGDLSVAYGVQLGRYQKIGHRVHVDFVIVTTTHTFTTASSELRITGLPFAAVSLASSDWTGPLQWQGITTTRSDMVGSITSTQSFIRFVASGSGLSRDSMDATTNTTSGTQITLMGHIEYEAAN